MRAVVTITRVWRLQWVISSMIAVAFVVRWHPRPIDVPGRSGGVEWVLSPVVPTAVGALLPAAVRRAHMPFECMSSRFQATGRLVVATFAWLACTVPVTIGAGALRVVEVRNGALVAGLVLGSVASLPSAVAWAPPVLLGVITWLIGVPPPGVAPPSWAVLLAPAWSPSALASSALSAAIGAGAFVTCTAVVEPDD